MGTSCLAAQHGLSISSRVWGHDRVAVPGLPWGPLPSPGLATGGAQRSQPAPRPSVKILGTCQGGWPTP